MNTKRMMKEVLELRPISLLGLNTCLKQAAVLRCSKRVSKQSSKLCRKPFEFQKSSSIPLVLLCCINSESNVLESIQAPRNGKKESAVAVIRAGSDSQTCPLDLSQEDREAIAAVLRSDLEPTELADKTWQVCKPPSEFRKICHEAINIHTL